MAEEMKKCEIEWCRQIPVSWSYKPSKYVMRKKKEICSHYNGEDIMSLTMDGVIIRDLDAGGKMPTTFDGYQKVYRGNLLMCLFDYDVTPRCIGLIEKNGLTSPAYSQFELKDGYSANYYYYYYLMIDNTKEILHLAKNLRHSFNEEQIGCLNVPVPPLNEQNLIADFLDEKCAEIDKLSEDIKKQIGILEEYKKSVITRVVTKGLEPNVEMKDSGLVWIRRIPSHWRLSRLKYMLSKNDGGVWGDDPRDPNECEVVLRSTEQTIDGKWSIEEPALRDLSSISYLDRYQICEDDLLITKSSGSHAHIGKTTLATKDDGVMGMYYSNFLQRLHTNKDLNSKYLWYLLNIDLSREQFVFMQNSTSGIGNINAENISNLTIPIPTNEEQIRIIDFLDGRCGEIDVSISKKREQFKVLLDYKKSIIYEYVTGKKRVA